jgi:hypothetical protein
MEPWFDKETLRIAALVVIFAGVGIGILLQLLAERGIARTVSIAVIATVSVLGLLTIVLGIAARFVDQPELVQKGLIFIGLIVFAVYAGVLPEMIDLYRKAELKKTIAHDL